MAPASCMGGVVGRGPFLLPQSGKRSATSWMHFSGGKLGNLRRSVIGPSSASAAPMMVLAVGIEHALDVTVQRSHDAGRRDSGRPSHGPEDSVRKQSLVAGVLPDRRLVAKGRIEYSPLAVKSGPGEWPTIESLIHAGLAKVN